MAIGIIFLGCATFLFLQDLYSTEIAFTVLGVFLLIIAGVVYLRSRNNLKPDADEPIGLKDDPLSALLPDIIKENDTIKNLVSQVSHNPLMATAAAVTLGIVLSREFFED